MQSLNYLPIQQQPTQGNLLNFIQSQSTKLPKFSKPKVVVKKYGIVEGFVTNTHQGTVRLVNEDRVSILLNAQQSSSIMDKARDVCTMFSVFDGHGGKSCCNYLKENLHQKILQNITYFLNNDDRAKETFESLDQQYMQSVLHNK